MISAGPRAGVMVGPTVARLAAAANIDTEGLVRPLLQELSIATGETVDLSVLQGDRAEFVDQVVVVSLVVANSAIGQAFPLHCTANVKALSSRLGPDRRERLLAGTLIHFTAQTIADPARLKGRARRDCGDRNRVEIRRSIPKGFAPSGSPSLTRSAVISRFRCQSPPRGSRPRKMTSPTPCSTLRTE